MPETFDSMRISSIFHNPSFTDSGVFLRLINGASGDVLALSHAENVFRRHRIAVGQHAPNEIFGCRRLGFGADAAEQFLRSHLIIALQPSETVAVMK